MNEVSNIYVNLAKRLRGEGDNTIKDGEAVRVPLMLTDAAPFTRATDAAIRRDRATRDAILTMDPAAHRPGNFFMCSQAHLTDSERQDLLDSQARAERAYHERSLRDREAYKRPPVSVATADTSAKVVDVRSLSLEDARKERERAWHERNMRDREAYKHPAPRVTTAAATGQISQLDKTVARTPQRDSREEIENTPLATLRARADAARRERDEKNRNAWRREPSPYLTNVRKAATELQNADDPIAKAQAAENLRIATVGGRGA